jgi:hypothetical protein
VASSDRQSTADEISRLADLQDKCVIDGAEFWQAKAKALSCRCLTLKYGSNNEEDL